MTGAQWLSGRVLDSRLRGRGFEPHWCHCVVSLSKNINPNLELVQPRKTRPFITEKLLMGRKESNQTKQKTKRQEFTNIRPLVKSAYQKKKNFLFLNRNICFGYSKEPSHGDGSFENPKHMIQLMGKTIFTTLRSKI